MNRKLIYRLCKNILKFRLIELEIAKQYRYQEMRCPMHLSIGQEAVSSAFAELVNKKDYAVSSHRSHIHYLAKGGNLKKMISEIYGKKNGCSKGKGGSMHLIDTNVNFMGSTAIVANSIPVGTGLGLSAKVRKTKQKSFIFFGEGATEQGAFYESVNFAAVKNLPAVYMCENNLYSVYSSLQDRQPKNRKIHKMVQSIGIKSYSCDGNNVVNCFNTIKKALNFVEEKGKPVFIEFFTYRHFEHCGPNIDDDLEYRPLKEVNLWKKRDPLNLSLRILNKNEKKKLYKYENSLKSEILLAFDYAKKSPYPKNKSAFEDVYA